MRMTVLILIAACGGGGADGGGADAYNFMDAPGTGDSPILGSCPVFPSNHIFNTPIGALPADPNSDTYIATIGGSRKLHLDLGTETDQTKDDYYGIPYNLVHGNALTWVQIAYFSPDTSDLDWDPKPESDCADASHAVVTPCTGGTAYLPIPNAPEVEGGIIAATNQLPYGDHHLLLVDTDSCKLWEIYHAYSPSTGVWNIFGSAEWDLRSNALRPLDWSSADAAGFPITPLLLKASEASSGTIKHALRFTIDAGNIRKQDSWPARHVTDTDMNAAHPPMGTLFRLKASFQIPTTDTTQAQAILQAMKTYGMYISDGGSPWYVQGEPSADWQDDTFSQVQSVTGSNFEAVDITAITSRAGWDANSGAVPPP